jgi:hypothetical protein
MHTLKERREQTLFSFLCVLRVFGLRWTVHVTEFDQVGFFLYLSLYSNNIKEEMPKWRHTCDDETEEKEKTG